MDEYRTCVLKLAPRKRSAVFLYGGDVTARFQIQPVLKQAASVQPNSKHGYFPNPARFKAGIESINH